MEFCISESENFGDIEISRSYDLVNWEKMYYANERTGRDFNIKDNVNLELELGVFYEIY